MKEMPNNLFELRRKKGVTQRQVAADIGVTPASISAFEKGTKTPQLETAIKLAEYYDVSLDNLCGIKSARRNDDKPITKADVFRTLTTLCEYPIPVNLSKEAGEESLSCSYFFAVDIRITDCHWLYEIIDTYNSILKLCKENQIPWEALQGWKAQTEAVLNVGLYSEEFETAKEIGV